MKKFVALFIVVLVIMLGCSTTAFAQQNLLANPSFEDTQEGLSHWDVGFWEDNDYLNIVEMSDDAYDGLHSAYIHSKSLNDLRLEQRVDVEPNTHYRLSGYIKAKGCTENGTGATLSFLDTFVSTDDLKDTNGQWEYVEVYVYTEYNQTQATVTARIGFYGSTNSGEAWFDNIVLEKIDSPAAGLTFQDISPIENNAAQKFGRAAF